jgi:hypothetical protein
VSSGNLKRDCLFFRKDERDKVSWEPSEVRTMAGPTRTFIFFATIALRAVPRGSGVALMQTPFI